MTENVCFSGGAIGADTAFDRAARSVGHEAIHFSFDGHKTSIADGTYVVLSEEELMQADLYIAVAAKIIQRNPPTDPVVKSLIRRNWYQAFYSDSVYAVGEISTAGKISGGTAWAVEMFLGKVAVDNPSGPQPVYFFDQRRKVWYQYDFQMGWVPIDAPPTPSGRYAGIGSRKLNANGAAAIEKIYQN